MSRSKKSCLVAAASVLASLAFMIVPGEARADEDPCGGLVAKHKYAPSSDSMFALAQCHDARGKTASAWVEYLETAQIAHRAKRTDVEATSNKRAAGLASKLSKLAVMVAPAADLDGVEVKRDGMVVDRAAWGTSAPVDPGEHVIEATAPGKQMWRRVVTVRPGANLESVTVGPLADLTSTTTISSAPADAVEAAPIMTMEQPDRVGRTQRIAGLTVAAIGVVGLAAGGYFGLRAIGHRDDATKACPNSPCSDRAGIDLNDQAKHEATTSTIALIGGGAAVLTGAILYFAAPKEAQHVGFVAAPGYAGISFRGAL